MMWCPCLFPRGPTAAVAACCCCCCFFFFFSFSFFFEANLDLAVREVEIIIIRKKLISISIISTSLTVRRQPSPQFHVEAWLPFRKITWNHVSFIFVAGGRTHTCDNQRISITLGSNLPVVAALLLLLLLRRKSWRSTRIIWSEDFEQWILKRGTRSCSEPPKGTSFGRQGEFRRFLRIRSISLFGYCGCYNLLMCQIHMAVFLAYWIY